nr:MAG TPA: hypothetical protein [Microviridae sp.]
MPIYARCGNNALVRFRIGSLKVIKNYERSEFH